MARPRDPIEAVNFRRVLLYLMELVSDHRLVISPEIIQRINEITLDGVPDLDGPPGRYKIRPNWVVNRATDEVVYTPPGPEKAPEMVDDMVQRLNRWMAEHDDDPDSVTTHPVTIAAMACHQLNHIHPFCDGNGRTARALATLILMRYGYLGVRTGDHLRPVKSLEWYFDAHRQEYAAHLREADQGKYISWLYLFSLAVFETMEQANAEKLAQVRRELEGSPWTKVAVAELPAESEGKAAGVE